MLNRKQRGLKGNSFIKHGRFCQAHTLVTVDQIYIFKIAFVTVPFLRSCIACSFSSTL